MSNAPRDPYQELPVNQSAVQGVSAGGNVTIGSINQVYNSSPQLTPEERRDREFRKKLLIRVRKDWFSILDERLSSKGAIEVSLKTRRDLIKKLSNSKISKPRGSDLETDIDTIVNQWENGQRLLILGNPGSGKTIALLQLGKKICDQAEANLLEKPIPVVFHLSSWKPGQAIDDWLIQQLESRYGFPIDISEAWVRNRNLFPLLDGLDELTADYQLPCILEINKFGASDIVVCSRVQQYEALARDMNLSVDQVVCVQPLKLAQINNYLESLNKSELKKVLSEDAQLVELARFPFWLTLIAEVDNVDTDLPRDGSFKARKTQLFDQYIEKTFTKVSNSGKLKYDKEITLAWLSWLASKSESVFLIEEMQPSWLTKTQKDLYFVINLAGATLLGLIFGPCYGFLISSYLSYSWEQTFISPISGLLFGMLAGITVAPLAHYFLRAHKLPIKTHNEVNLSFKKIQDSFWKSLARSFYEAVVVGLLVSLFCFLFLPPLQKLINLSFSNTTVFWIGILGGFYFGLVTLVLRLLSNSLVKKKAVKTVKPNQGILNSYKQSRLIAKITIYVLSILLTLAILIVHAGDPDKLPLLIVLGLCLAVVTGPVAATIHHSGQSCQQHFYLRLVLYLTGSIPWNYSEFLDYVSSELTFLNKIGGGYQFFHGLFQGYLASFKPDQLEKSS